MALSKSVLSSKKVFVSHDLSARNLVEGVSSSNSPIVCQICYHPDYSTQTCPSRYAPQSAPAFVAMSTGETNESLCYPDSGASSHITNNEGMLSSKHIYNGPTHVTIANGSNLPIS